MRKAFQKNSQFPPLVRAAENRIHPVQRVRETNSGASTVPGVNVARKLLSLKWMLPKMVSPSQYWLITHHDSNKSHTIKNVGQKNPNPFW